jgi:hypothetical protein
VRSDGKSEYELVLKRSQLTPSAAGSATPTPLSEKGNTP